MPYVQRNWRGEITGISELPQRNREDAEEFLPENNPEVTAYREKHPPPDWRFTPEELARLTIENDKSKDELKAIQNAVTEFNVRFSDVEIALGSLLHALLNVRESKIAQAIYYSPTSFDARAELVGNALIELATERAPLNELLPLWNNVATRIRRVRNLRNAVAHSSPLIYSVGDKLHARLSPPAFDAIRVGRILKNRQIPGISAHDLKTGIGRMELVIRCIDSVNRLVTEFHDGNPSLQKRYDALATDLRALGSPPSKEGPPRGP